MDKLTELKEQLDEATRNLDIATKLYAEARRKYEDEFSQVYPDFGYTFDTT